jgi:hypothetical protein
MSSLSDPGDGDFRARRGIGSVRETRSFHGWKSARSRRRRGGFARSRRRARDGNAAEKKRKLPTRAIDEKRAARALSSARKSSSARREMASATRKDPGEVGVHRVDARALRARFRRRFLL